MTDEKGARIADRLTGGKALSHRWLPDGGMCVIAADGRKLWFDPPQVGRAVERTVDAHLLNEAPRVRMKAGKNG